MLFTFNSRLTENDYLNIVNFEYRIQNRIWCKDFRLNLNKNKSQSSKTNTLTTVQKYFVQYHFFFRNLPFLFKNSHWIFNFRFLSIGF